MTSWQGITEALAGALAIGWGLFVEYRLRQAQDATTQLKREFLDEQETDSVHALSDDKLNGLLSEELGGGPPGKPKT